MSLGARQYNPVTGRWDRMDQLAEKDPGVSPYLYCGNNPVMFVDPDGSPKRYCHSIKQFFIERIIIHSLDLQHI